MTMKNSLVVAGEELDSSLTFIQPQSTKNPIQHLFKREQQKYF